MSAIAGIFDLGTGQSVADRDVAKMLGVMPHRELDGGQVVSPAPGVQLGWCAGSSLHSELQTNQPMSSADGRYTVTFDGFIANYAELRALLENCGRQFRTNLDCELLLQAFQEWNADTLTRLNGMWSFVLYDRVDDTLFCARDRFGIKPFNYTVHRGRFLFASEAKAILAVEPSLAEPDYDTLSRVVRASVGARDSGTCFAKIKRLRAARYMIVSRDGVQTPKQYWDFPKQSVAMTLDEAAGNVRDLLTDSVGLLMRGGSGVTLSLSSGLDSSAIAALVRVVYSGPFDTYTSSHPGEPDDEAPAAAALSKQLSMDHHAVPVGTDDFLPTFRTIVRRLESPTHVHGLFPFWYMLLEAKQHATAVLDGSAADGILAGSKANFHEIVFAHLANRDYAQAYNEVIWSVRSGGLIKPTLMAMRQINPPFLHRLYRWYRGDERVYIGPLRGRAELPETRQSDFQHQDRLNALLMFRLERLRDLLHNTDAVARTHGVEPRYPFLDYRLVEYCLRIPGLLKYHDGFGKAVLRRAMVGLLPDSLLQSRAKLGFPTPISRWFREQPEVTLYPILRSQECRNRGVFSPQRIDWAIERHVSGKADLASNLFRWMITELWFQEFIDSSRGYT